MLSGNGRHRRPRQAPALIVAAGVTGSAIAIPLLAATSASAASTATWDKLAECESGGSWSADPGNGYYGGLQFSQEMWEDYGGLDFAPRADQASRSQQIAVAEKVLDDQGPRAWPVCSVTSGLTSDAAAAEVDPGAALPTPSASADDSGSDDAAKGDASADPSDTATPDATDDPREKNHDNSGDTASNTPDASDGDKSGQDGSTSAPATPSPETSAGSDSTAPPASGRHRGDAADDESTGSSRADDGSGRHASRGDESGRKDANPDEGTYTVRAGDNLWDIADTHDVDGGWSALYAENKKTVGADPDLILPGQSLDLGLESVEK